MIAAFALSLALFVSDPCVPSAPFRMPADPRPFLGLADRPGMRRRWFDRSLCIA